MTKVSLYDLRWSPVPAEESAGRIVGDAGMSGNVPEHRREWAAHELLAELPDDIHDIASRHWMDGDSEETLEARYGVSRRQIRNRLQTAVTLLQRMFHDRCYCTD